VLVFNFLSGRITTYESGLLNAGSELVDRLEMNGDAAPQARSHPVSQPQPKPQPALSQPLPQVAGQPSHLRDRFR
jgi:hypothetical protein